MSKIEELLNLIAENKFEPQIMTAQDKALQRFDDDSSYRT